MDVSIIIVNYNTKKLIKECMESIYKETHDIDYEIIVSDNGSTDGSVGMINTEFPNVILIENNANLGFGAANNRGLDVAKGKYVLFLNSDTLVLNNAVKIFFDYWENLRSDANVGALGANLVDSQGEIIHSYGFFPVYNKELFSAFKTFCTVTFRYFLSFFGKRIPLVDYSHASFIKIGSVDYITGADLFMLNNSDARFDEDFFMYCEDVDIQYKLFQKGKERILIDGPRIMHLHGASDINKAVDKVRLQGNFSSVCFNISRIKYFRKRGCPTVALFLLKVLTLFTWLNPLVFKSARSKIKELLDA